MLRAEIGVARGDLDLSVDLTVDDGEVVAVLGPNGAGKTTLVRALAGLLPIERGRVEVDREVLDDPTAGVFVPPERRSVGVVFQDYALFPRLTARDNVAFGLQARGMDRRASLARADEWLDRLGVADQSSLHPASLSGGQAQRVAVARALAIEPRLLLLDEPLAALDASSRLHVRSELRRHLASFGGLRVLVTHDPIDALVLADRLVIVEGGRVAQTGTPAEVTARPATGYVADLVGINLLRGRRDGDRVELGGGGVLTIVPPDGLESDDVAVAIRPQAVALHRSEPSGSPRNTWAAAVHSVEHDRDRVRVTLGGAVPVTAEITTAAAVSLGLEAGQQVWASVKAVDLAVYEA